MWYRVKARDNRIFLPSGKVITFSIWAETDRQFWKLMEEKKITEVKIIKKLQLIQTFILLNVNYPTQNKK